ncbi:hypothetical protein BJ878DRAFT_545426 [Calycina marina]|uniref:Uncharacterized protein n=1 Tax=Calycina marina TaxID=1763456 RepID=A0A9P7YWT3_9HELO|nr:hypothetical protein BJ878DRAFT_545426 [Calycina marina]
MASDFIELGMEGIDKIVDKHFHRLPDKALHKSTYYPKRFKDSARRRMSKKGTQDSRPQTEFDSDEEAPMRKSQSSRRRQPESEGEEDYTSYNHRRNMHNTSSPPPFNPSISPSPYSLPLYYSQQAPKLRTQHLPQNHVLSSYMPPSSEGDEKYYSDSLRPSRRPLPVTRRSSSYHGPRRRDQSLSSGSDYSCGGQRRKEKSHMAVIKRESDVKHREVVRDRSHRYGLKDETLGRLTDSPIGVTASAAGGLFGAWAGSQAKIMSGIDQKKDSKTAKSGSGAMKFLGAAVGALAVNVAVNRWEEQKKEGNKEDDRRWNEKFGIGDEGESPVRRRRGSGSGRRENGEGSRRNDSDNSRRKDNEGRDSRARRRDEDRRPRRKSESRRRKDSSANSSSEEDIIERSGSGRRKHLHHHRKKSIYLEERDGKRYAYTDSGPEV